MDKKEKLKKRHTSIRSRVFGTPERPRLQVFRSLKHVYAQIIDDTTGKTILAESDCEKKLEKGDVVKNKKNGKTARATEVGEKIAKKAKEKKIQKVVFDRKGYLYHGRVKAVAEGARKEGLEF
jgi:large subunit ribosomal protein L18